MEHTKVAEALAHPVFDSESDANARRRAHALEIACRLTAPRGKDHHELLVAAREIEAYLKGGQ